MADVTGSLPNREAILAHGREWHLLAHAQGRTYLAVERGAEFPAAVHLVEVPQGVYPLGLHERRRSGDR